MRFALFLMALFCITLSPSRSEGGSAWIDCMLDGFAKSGLEHLDPGRTRVASKPKLYTFKTRNTLSLGSLPPAKPGTVRVYRASGHSNYIQLSINQRALVNKDPTHVPPSGARTFLDAHEAAIHSRDIINKHPDAISVTTDLDTVLGIKEDVMVFDVPRDVFDKLPDETQVLGLGGKVFKNSIPDEYLVGVIPLRKQK